MPLPNGVVVRVDYVDGDFDFIREPSLLKSIEIEKYIQFFLDTIGAIPVYPGDTVIPGTEQTIQDYLFVAYRRHYEKIASFFDPRIRLDDLTAKSRHEFFVCTSPKEESAVAGVSLAQKLLGHDLTIKSKKQSPTKKISTSGNYRADIAAAVGLSFKGQTQWLNYPVSFLLQVLEQAANLSQLDKKDESVEIAGSTINPDAIAKTVDMEAFEKVKPQVMAFLDELGVRYPDEF